MHLVKHNSTYKGVVGNHKDTTLDRKTTEFHTLTNYKTSSFSSTLQKGETPKTLLQRT
jgi:hypothetical protein